MFLDFGRYKYRWDRRLYEKETMQEHNYHGRSWHFNRYLFKHGLIIIEITLTVFMLLKEKYYFKLITELEIIIQLVIVIQNTIYKLATYLKIKISL